MSIGDFNPDNISSWNALTSNNPEFEKVISQDRIDHLPDAEKTSAVAHAILNASTQEAFLKENPELSATLPMLAQRIKDTNLLQMFSKLPISEGQRPALSGDITKDAVAIRAWMNVDANRQILSGIRKLELEGLHLTALPSEIQWLTNLQKLNLSNNQIETLPDEINLLTNLRSFAVDNNQLKALPPLNLPHVTYFSVKNNQLLKIPETMILPNLMIFHLTNNFIENWPAALNLQNLGILRMDHNELRDFPQNPNLPNLNQLNIEFNHIVDLPEGLNLPWLTNLILSNNPIDHLPANVNMPSLHEIDLTDTQIQVLWEEKTLISLPNWMMNRDLKVIGIKRK